MKPRRLSAARLSFPLASAIAALLAMSSAFAGTVTWNAGTLVSTNGSWTTPTNWTADTAPVAGDDLIFAGTDNQTNSNDIPLTSLNSLTLNNAGWNITLGTVTLNGGGLVANGNATVAGSVALGAAQTWSNSAGLLTFNGALDASLFSLTFGGAGNTTLDSAIANGTTLTKSGAGTLTLVGSNGFTSATINGGTITGTLTSLALSGGATALTSSATSAVNSDVFINTAAGTVTSSAGTLTLGGTLDAGSLDLTFASAGNTTVSNAIANGTTLTKTGAGNLTLSGLNTYAGTTTVNGGTVSITHNDALGTTAGKTVLTSTVSGNVQLSLSSATSDLLNVAEEIDFNGNAIGRAVLINSSAFNHTLTGAITVTAAGGGFPQWESASTGSITITGDITGDLGGSAILIRGASNGDNKITGNISTTNGGITKTDGGTWTIGGGVGKTYTAPALASANGTLKMGALNYLTSAPVVTMGNSTGGSTGTLDLSGFSQTVGGIIYNGAGVATGTRTITSSTGAAVLTVNNATDFTATGSGANSVVLTGNLGLTKQGVGTLSLGGTNTYLGATTVEAGGGTLQLGNGTTSGSLSISSAISVGLGGTFAVNQTDTVTQGTDFSNVLISGDGGFKQAGTGTTVLNLANIHTGGTTVTDGRLIATSGSALGSGSLTVDADKSFAYRPTAAGPLNIGGTLNLGNGTTTNIGTALGGNLSESVIAVTGAASLAGTGVVNINLISGVSPTLGTNDLITATTGLDGGTYTLGTVFNNSNFTVSGFTRTPGAISVDVTAAAALSGSVFWKGGLAGNTGVWAASTGLSGGQSNWQVTNGTNQPLVPGAAADLVFSAATSPGTMAGMTLGADMTLQSLTVNNTATAFGLGADGFTLTLTPATPAGGITLNNGVLASTIGANVALGADQTWTNNSANTLTVSGVVSGAGSLTKAGAGSVALTAANTYTGTTTLTTPGTLANSTAGPLTLSGNGSINASTGLTLTGGSLTLTNTSAAEAALDRVSSSAIISNGGTVTFTNTSGANVYAETIGSVALTTGHLNLVETTTQASTGSQTLTLLGLTRTGVANASAVAFSAGTTAPNNTKNMIVVTGGGTTPPGQIAGPWATTGTAANAQNDYAVYSSDFVIPAGASLTTPGESGWLSSSAAYIVAGASNITTNLGGNRTAAALRNNTNAGTAATFSVGSTITVTGHTFANGDPVVFGGGAVPGTAASPVSLIGSFTYGRVYYVVNQAANTIQVAPTVGGTPIVFTSVGATVNVTGGIRLGNNTLGTYGVLNSSAAVMPIAASGGTGVLTTPSGGGNLYLNGGTGGLSIAGPIADSSPTEPVTVVISGRPQTTPDNGNATFAGSVIFMQPGAGPANTYSGGTVINSGDIVVNHGNLSGGSEIAFGLAGTPITFNGSASYMAQFPGGNDQSSFNAHPIVLNNGAIMSVYTTSNRPTMIFSGPISGNGGVAFQLGNNIGVTMALSNTGNTFTGPVTVGRLSSSAFANVLLRTASLADSPGAGNIQLMEGAPATFAYNGSSNFALNHRQVALFGVNNRGAAAIDSSGVGTFTVNTDLIAPTTTLFSRIFQLQGTNTGSNVFNGKISNGPTTVISLTKAGAGTWNVSNANTFTGPVRTTAGTLIVNNIANGGSPSSIGQSISAPACVVLSGGTLRYAPIATVGGAAATTDRNFTITASTSLDSSGTGALVFGQTGIISPDAPALGGSAAATNNGIITGLSSTANLTVGMTVNVTGAFTGTRTINSIDSATQITLSASSTTVGAVTLTFGTPTARTLTLTGTNTDANTIAGILQNSSAAGAGVLSLTKSGVGSWVLTGPNTYSGATTVNAGTLTLGNTTALGTSAASVTTGGSLNLGGQTITNAVSTTATGILTGSGSVGAATLSGSMTPGGSSIGLITLATATVNATSSVTLQLPATGTRGVDYDAVTVSGPLALDGTVTVNIAGLTPTIGQSFDLFDANGSTGPINVTNFTVATDLILPVLPAGLGWDRSLFASDGVVSIIDPYAAWAALKGLTGAPGLENGKGADPDGDGRVNLDEFAFDGDPLSGANDGKIVGKIATVGGNQVLTLTLPVRVGATFTDDLGDELSALIDGIHYRIEGDVDLSSFAAAITEVPAGADRNAIQLGLPTLSSGDWTYRTFRAPNTVPTVPKAFIRAKISETP